MKINQLSSTENISLQDKFLIFSVKNGDERIASINSLTKFLNTNTIDESYINQLINTSLIPFNNKLTLNSTSLLNLETRVNNVSDNLSNVSASLSSINNLSSTINSISSSISNNYIGLDYFIVRGTPKKQVFSLQYNNLPNTATNKNLLRFAITPASDYNAVNLTKIRVILTVDLLVESFNKSTPSNIIYTTNYKGMAIYDYMLKDTAISNSANVSYYASPFNPNILSPTKLYTNISGVPSFGANNNASSDLTSLIFSLVPDSFSVQNGVSYAYMFITLPYLVNTAYSGTAKLNVSMIHNHTSNAQIADSGGNFSIMG